MRYNALFSDAGNYTARSYVINAVKHNIRSTMASAVSARISEARLSHTRPIGTSITRYCGSLALFLRHFRVEVYTDKRQSLALVIVAHVGVA
jgi:hypothetical protein